MRNRRAHQLHLGAIVITALISAAYLVVDVSPRAARRDALLSSSATRRPGPDPPETRLSAA